MTEPTGFGLNEALAPAIATSHAHPAETVGGRLCRYASAAFLAFKTLSARSVFHRLSPPNLSMSKKVTPRIRFSVIHRPLSLRRNWRNALAKPFEHVEGRVERGVVTVGIVPDLAVPAAVLHLHAKDDVRDLPQAGIGAKEIAADP
jgi:hypothetical protein